MRQWVKLHTVLVNDPKMHELSDSLFRVCINLIAIGGIVDDNGRVGTPEDLSFYLRKPPRIVRAALETLSQKHITTFKNDTWFLENWSKYNGIPPSDTAAAIRERVAKSRKNKTKDKKVTRYLGVTNEDSNTNVTPQNRIEENRIEESRTEGGASATPAPQPQKPTKVKEQPPSVQAFQHAAGSFPAKALWQSMDEAIGSVPADLAFWEQVVQAWIAKGWNPRNLTGMFDFYKRRELPTSNGAGKKQAGRYDGMLSALEKIEREEANGNAGAGV